MIVKPGARSCKLLHEKQLPDWINSISDNVARESMQIKSGSLLNEAMWVT